MSVSPQEWFERLPPITKTYLVGAVGTTMAVTFGVVGVEYLYLDFGLIYKKFQVWRIITCFFFFGKFSYPFLFQMFILGRYFNMVETEQYPPSTPGKTADMFTMVLFGAVVMLLAAWVTGMFFFLGPAMSFMLLYIWTCSDPRRPISFWGFQIQAWHLPFVMLAMALLMKSSPVLDLLGILVGHLWWFLSVYVPKAYGVNLVPTPNFIRQLFGGQGMPLTRTSRFAGAGYRLN